MRAARGNSSWMAQNPVLSFNEQAYRSAGFGAQRRYPNEELCRFMGRNFFALPRDARAGVRILELGCGSGANLWMIAREGFDAYGIDLAPAALPLAEQMLENYGGTAHLRVADMTAVPFADRHFDAVLDVFSTYCLDESGFRKTLAEVARLLKPAGRFFCYTPGKGSQAWTDHAPATMIDGSTLNGVMRETSAYWPSPYPFRFITETEAASELAAHGLAVTYSEKVTRTYRGSAELFEFVVIEARSGAT
jgi:SAM-dependent methyltransferase